MRRYPQLIWALYALLLLLAFYSWQMGWTLLTALTVAYVSLTLVLILYKLPQLLTAPLAYAQYLQAMQLTRLNNDKEAFHLIEQALAAVPRFALAYALRGTLYLRDERPHLALDDFNTALQLAPHLGQARLTRTMALARVGKVVEAREAVVNTRYANRALRGTAALYTYEYKVAYADLRRALRWQRFLGRVDATLLNNLGVAALHTERHEEAQAYLGEALTGPKPYFAWANLGYLLGNSEQPDAALVHINQALELKPDYHHARGYRAYVQWLAGNYEAALDDAYAALEFAPQHLPHQVVLIASLFAVGKHSDALEAWHALNDHKTEPLSIAQMQQRYGWHSRFVAALKAIDTTADA